MRYFFSTVLLTFIFSVATIKAQNKMDNNQKLDIEQQCIVRISALTAIGDIDPLKIQLGKGLDAGLTVNEIREVSIQLYAYCGFPRSLNAINAFMAVLEKRKTRGVKDVEGKISSPVADASKYQTGKNTLQTLTGKEEQTLSGANAFAPAIDTFLKEHLFADIFSRDVLSFQQRELVTVSALAAMTGVASQLQAHIGMAMNTGLAESQFTEAFLIIDELAGKNQGDLARATLEKVKAAKKE